MLKKGPLKTIGKGLAGALAIASSTSAYGTIVFVNTPPDLMTTAGGANAQFSWDVNGDGIFDFQFRDRYPNTAPGSTGVIWQAAVFTASINGIVSYAGPNIRYAYALNYGDFVGSFSPGIAESGNQAITLGSRYSYGSANVYYYGGFANAAVGVAPGTFAFAGFRFTAADGIHYGYIRLRVSPGVIDFDFAAYETTPGEPIGQPVPEPGTMALLAFGAVGVIGAIAKRRRD